MTENTDVELKFIELSSYAKGIQEERKRIIKLLEDSEPDNITSQEDNFWSGYQTAIALIKGEK